MALKEIRILLLAESMERVPLLDFIEAILT